MAVELGIISRYVRKLWAKFQSACRILVPHKVGHQRNTITHDMVVAVLDCYDMVLAGIVCLASYIRKTSQDKSFCDVHIIIIIIIMKSENMVRCPL